MRASSTLLALALCAVASALARDTHAQVVFQYDHAARRISVVEGADKVERLSNGRFRMKRAGTARLDVVNTNTAIYRVSFDTDTLAGGSFLGPVQAFLTRAKPFFPEIALAMKGPAKGRGERVAEPEQAPSTLPSISPSESWSVRTALESGRIVEQSLQQLDALILGPRGVEDMTALSLRTLERMRQGDATMLANALRDSLGLPHRMCGEGGAGQDSLRLAGAVLGAMSALGPATLSLHRTMVDTIFKTDTTLRDLHGRLLVLRQAADSALADQESLASAAYRAEWLARTVAAACSRSEGRIQRITSGAGRVLAVKIEPRTDPELARVADRQSTVEKVSVLSPTSLVESSLGLSFLVAPSARYQTYGARSAVGGGTEIYVPSTRDARFGWGATLGVTWRPVNGRGKSGLALWVPELTVAEATSTPAFGVGTAVSLGMVKLGVGALWVRHSELVGQSVGDKIPNEKFLQTQDAYGRPAAYVALSIFEWPPFLSR